MKRKILFGISVFVFALTFIMNTPKEAKATIKCPDGCECEREYGKNLSILGCWWTEDKCVDTVDCSGK